MRHPAAPVMATDVKFFMPQVCHESGHIGCHCAFGVIGVVFAGGRFVGLAVAAEVWDDEGVVREEVGSYEVPY